MYYTFHLSYPFVVTLINYSHFFTCRVKHHVYQPTPLHLNFDVGISGFKKKGFLIIHSAPSSGSSSQRVQQLRLDLNQLTPNVEALPCFKSWVTLYLYTRNNISGRNEYSVSHFILIADSSTWRMRLKKRLRNWRTASSDRQETAKQRMTAVLKSWTPWAVPILVFQAVSLTASSVAWRRPDSRGGRGKC